LRRKPIGILGVILFIFVFTLLVFEFPRFIFGVILLVVGILVFCSPGVFGVKKERTFEGFGAENLKIFFRTLLDCVL
jgi:hypothetical protein